MKNALQARKWLRMILVSGFLLSLNMSYAQYDFTWSDSCNKDTVQFTINDPTGITSLLWDFGDPLSGNNTSVLLSPTHVFSLPGFYDVTLTINGGTSTVIKKVRIHALPKISDVYTTVCKGITIIMKTDTGNQMKHYLWNTGETTQTLTFRLVKDTIFSCKNYDFNECIDLAYFRIKALKINTNFDVNLAVQCLNNNYYLFHSYADTIRRPWLQYQWNFGDGNVSGQTNPSHVYGMSGSFVVQMVIYPQDSIACADTAYKDVNVISQSTPNFDFDVDRCKNLVRVMNTSGAALTYDWDFGNGVRYYNKRDTYMIYSQKGTYDITLITNRGTTCADSLTRNIEIEPVDTNTFIPNAFTPNIDEINDTFRIEGLDFDCFPYDMYIFNRWGEKVYEGLHQTGEPRWDGKFQNTLVLPGTYYYFIRAKGVKRYGTLAVIY